MRTTPAPGTTVTRPRFRPARTVALTAVALLALGACGLEETGGPSQDRRSGAAAIVAAATPPAATPPTTGATPPAPDGEVAFMEMLNTLAAPCAPASPAGPKEPAGEETPPTRPVERLPVDPAPPAPDHARQPDAPGTGEAELTAFERCAARPHAARVSQALDGLADPSPERVGAALRRLGYPAGRVHGLRRSGESTRFLLDLRSMGGQLCLSGRVTVSRIEIEPFGLSPDAAITNVKRTD